MATGICLPANTSFDDFLSCVASVTKTVAEATLIAAKKIPLPSLNVTPNGANHKALEKLWKRFFKKYENTWLRYRRDPERAWACCVVIWTNFCLKRRMQPFDANATEVTQETKDKLEDRVIRARGSQLEVLESLVSAGSRKGIISKVLKEVFDGINEGKPGEFTITTRRFIKFADDLDLDSREVRDFLVKKNFQRKNKKYIRDVKTNTRIAIAYDTDNDRPVILFQNNLTSAYCELLLNIPSKKGNRDAIKKALVRYWKLIMKELN